VVLSHRSLVNNAFFIGERLRYSESDRVCLPVPLHHTFGHMLGSLATLTHGAAMVLPGAMFDPRACLDSIEMEQCTAFYGVPAMFAAVLAHPRFAAWRLASLRTGIMAGAPCPIELMRSVVTTMHMPELTICYGLTEGGTIFQSQPDDPVDRRIATVGAVHPHVECKIVDPATPRVVPRGVTGELWVRSFATMIGYWNDEAATREVVQPGGWLRTGDLAVMRDDGRVNVAGRLKEMVVSGGRNIYPREIEDTLRTHAKVREVAVVGIPDPVYGEATCAWIQPHEGEHLTADELLRFCRERVAPYNVPRRIRLTDGFPTTASGKIQKFRLREQAIRELGLAVLEDIQTA
jgi:fatty-acyl-CoA synthase